MLTLLFLLGCGNQVTGNTVDTADTGVFTTDADFVVGAIWEDDGLTLSISGGHPDGYGFGMAQTGVADGWMGEDCTSGDGSDGLCHPAGSDGLSLESVHQDVGGPGTVGVSAGQTTWFYDGIADTVTFILIENASQHCWSWGEDPKHYAVNGCIQL